MNFIKFYCKNYYNSTGARSLVAGGKNDALPPGTQEKVHPVKTGRLAAARHAGAALRPCQAPGSGLPHARPLREHKSASK